MSLVHSTINNTLVQASLFACEDSSKLPVISVAANVGLSTLHIRPLKVRVVKSTLSPPVKSEPTIKFWSGGGLVSVKTGLNAAPGSGARGLRGKVGGFSAGSRRRLMRKLATINKNSSPKFVTMTYPGEYSHSADDWKRHLSNFFKRFFRRFGKAGVIWRLERQRRGAPHFHLFVWGVDYAELREWVSRAWYEVVGSGDLRHLVAGCRVEILRSWRGVRSYASKYLAKVTSAMDEVLSDWLAVGRWWGIRCPDNIPWADVIEIHPGFGQCYQVLRWLRRYAKLPSRSYDSLTVFVDDGLTWLNCFNRYFAGATLL